MARKLTPVLVAQIHARRAQGLTHEQLAAEFRVSRGSVNNALKLKPEVTWQPERDRPTQPPVDSVEADEAELDSSSGHASPARLESLDDLRAALVEQLDTLRALALDAKAAGNGGVSLQIARATGALVKEVARLTPPEPPDHEQAPDMVAAADRMREALHAMVERELEKVG